MQLVIFDFRVLLSHWSSLFCVQMLMNVSEMTMLAASMNVSISQGIIDVPAMMASAWHMMVITALVSYSLAIYLKNYCSKFEKKFVIFVMNNIVFLILKQPKQSL